MRVEVQRRQRCEAEKTEINCVVGFIFPSVTWI